MTQFKEQLYATESKISRTDPSTWPVFLDADQVSYILAIPKKTIWELLKAGKIKGKKIGR